jgi:hypothetical protein
MRGSYRGELHTLRARIRELEQTVGELRAAHRIGPEGETEGAKTGYAMGRRVRRAWRRLFRRGEDEAEVERLRDRAQLLERIIAGASDEPIWGPPDPDADEAAAETSGAYRAGQRLRRTFKRDE